MRDGQLPRRIGTVSMQYPGRRCASESVPMLVAVSITTPSGLISYRSEELFFRYGFHSAEKLSDARNPGKEQDGCGNCLKLQEYQALATSCCQKETPPEPPIK